MAKSIAESIDEKINSIKSEQEKLAAELKHWQKVASDYETNRTTIESILGIHNAPDLAVKKTRRKRNTTA